MIKCPRLKVAGESMLKVAVCPQHDFPQIEDFTNFIKRKPLDKGVERKCGTWHFYTQHGMLMNQDCKEHATAILSFRRVMRDKQGILRVDLELYKGKFWYGKNRDNCCT